MSPPETIGGAALPTLCNETISVAIARPLAYNWTQVDACLRGPRLAPLERQVRALLGSTRFLAP